MSASKILLAIVGFFLLIGVICVLWGVGAYNGLVAQKNGVDGQWANVQAVYQRRFDLIPNLVATVAGSANFEKSTLTAVTNARASVGRVQLPSNAAPTDPAQLAQFEQAQGQLGASLARLLVVSEKYPELRSTTAFRDLSAQIEGTENRISVERQRFNQVVQSYNTAIARFPAMIVARLGGFVPHPYFASQAGAESAPKVDFTGKF